MGDGWAIVEPGSAETETWEPFDEHVPKAQWFWGSVERWCVAGCCGLDAFDFSHQSIRWACGDLMDPPADDGRSLWRDPAPGDVLGFADELQSLSQWLRKNKAPAVSADCFNQYLSPNSYADLFDDLAWKLRNPIPR